MKVFLMICAAIVAVVGFFILQTKWNTHKIDQAIQGKAYHYYCVVNSADITAEGDQSITTIDSNIINLGNLWGNRRMAADGSYAVIFTNDLTNAIAVDMANRDMVAKLSDKKIPFCVEIK